jgi:hypothetical protein
MMELAPSSSFRITAFGAWLAALFLTLPFVVVFPVSLTPQRYLSLPDGHWSLRHYATLIDDPTWLSSIRDSLIVATGSTLIALLLGTMTALACWRLSSRLSEAVRMVMLAPMIVPSIVHALGFYQVWATLGLLDTYQGVIIAHAMKAIPYVVISVSAALANVDFRLEQAAGGGQGDPARREARHAGRRGFCFRAVMGRTGGQSLHLEPPRVHAAAQDLGRHPGQHQPGHRRRGVAAHRAHRRRHDPAAHPGAPACPPRRAAHRAVAIFKIISTEAEGNQP